MRQDDEKLKADLNRMMTYLKQEMSDTDHEATRRQRVVEQASENKTGVPPGLDLLDLHSVPDPGRMWSVRGASSQVCSEDLPQCFLSGGS